VSGLCLALMYGIMILWSILFGAVGCVCCPVLTKTNLANLHQFGKKKKYKSNLVIDEDEPMPLTYKYHYLDRNLRKANVNMRREDITYRPMADSQFMGNRFQEAFLDRDRDTVLGVRIKDRNPKNVYYKKNKYGADLVF